MNIIIYTVVILTIFYFLLRLITNISSRKISKGLRFFIILGLFALAVLFAIGGKFLLTVRTKQVNKSENNNADGEIIHKGISQRQFARSFTIADDVKVNGAELKDGLLTISCERIVPEHKKRKLIEIK